MSDSITMEDGAKVKSNVKSTPFNWSVVGFLLFMTAIPAVPAIFLLTLVAIGPSNGVSELSIVNVLHFDAPGAIFVHGVAGILFFLTMPFQFSPALRAKNITLHKVGGRIALLSGYVMGLSAIWMHHVLYIVSFDARYISLLVMSVAMCVAFSFALWHVINRNIQSHRTWMVRAVAITLGAVTPLFFEVILFLVFGQFESTLTIINQFQHDYGRLVGVAINLSIVEYMFFKEQRKKKAQSQLTNLSAG
jgi:hypothetical protein